MTPLWIAFVALLMVALLLLVPALLKAPARRPVTQAGLRRLYAAQMEELEGDLRSGALDSGGRPQALDDLHRRLLEELAPAGAPSSHGMSPRWTGWGLASALSIALPIASLMLYSRVGDPRAAATEVLAREQAPAHALGAEGVDGMVNRLAARLRSQPDDLEGWVVLARSYEVLERFDDAAAAYRRAIALAPDRPQLLADYADALASTRDGDLGGPVQAAIDAALAIDPDHPKALALAGMAAYRQGDPALARRRWERLHELLPPDSEAALRVEADLARLDDRQPAPSPPARSASGPAAGR